ncbi:hypothetical protein [Streptomyces sp. NPDC059411]|uniref:hypothetical protein n=1 Tax=Streptomyces sp. NPDC059411 TaxID=3346825 RepID=UPI003692A95F
MGAAAGTPIAYFSPLLVVMTVLYRLDRRLDGPELTAVVRIPLHDLAAVAATYQYGGHAVARWWALPLHPAQSAGAWAGSAVLLVVVMLVSRAATRGSRMGS